MADPRWDGDERGEGVADATGFLDGISELEAAMRRPNWVSEDPELHLLPHLERACESLPLRILDARTSDAGVYEVQLGWTGDEPRAGLIRAAVFGLLGGIAESSSFVRQHRPGSRERPDGTLIFEVVTGMVDETPFKPHGHTLRLTVTPSS